MQRLPNLHYRAVSYISCPTSSHWPLIITDGGYTNCKLSNCKVARPDHRHTKAGGGCLAWNWLKRRHDQGVEGASGDSTGGVGCLSGNNVLKLRHATCLGRRKLKPSMLGRGRSAVGGGEEEWRGGGGCPEGGVKAGGEMYPKKG